MTTDAERRAHLDARVDGLLADADRLRAWLYTLAGCAAAAALTVWVWVR